MPKLLVSVRNQTEARAAIAGGCQLLDIKNPAAGPLGRPATDIVSALLQVAETSSSDLPISAALGELAEAENACHSEIWNQLQYLKVGSAGISEISAWKDQFTDFRRHWQTGGVNQPQWIAACYLDFEQAESFNPLNNIKEMVTALMNTGCCGLLLDTFDKSSFNTFEILQQSPMKLTALLTLQQRLKAHKLLLAVAGRLAIGDILKLYAEGMEPDFWAVRSAVCAAGDRLQSVSVDLVRSLRSTIDSMNARPESLSQ